MERLRIIERRGTASLPFIIKPEVVTFWHNGNKMHFNDFPMSEVCREYTILQDGFRRRHGLITE